MSRIRLAIVKTLLRSFKGYKDYTNILNTRKTIEKLAGTLDTRIKGIEYSAQSIDGLECEWIIPASAMPKKVLLYFHGGGYAICSSVTHRDLVSDIARHAGISALVVNYRLAPEFKYPAPVEDAAKIYNWLLANGYSGSEICLGGDSAGGGIVISTLAYLRNNKITQPKCAFVISPWLDLSLTGDSYKTKQKQDPMLPANVFPVWRDNYLGGADTLSEYASPIFHSLKGLPPVLVQVGEDELLLSDSVRFAAKAKEDGVDVRLEVYPRMFHVFNAFWRIIPKAREANRKLGEFIKAQLA